MRLSSFTKDHKFSSLVIDFVNRLSGVIFSCMLGLVAGGLFLSTAVAGLDRSPAPFEVDYSPAHGATVSVNPPPFVWLPIEKADHYLIHLSRSSGFDEAGTIVIDDLRETIHVPGEVMGSGKWYWRYGYSKNGETQLGQPRAFTIAQDAVHLPFPDIEEVVTLVPTTRPRLYHTPEDVESIRSDLEGSFAEVVATVVSIAEDALARKEELFPEPLPWEEYENPFDAHVQAFRSMRPYTARMGHLARAYLYTGDPRFAEEAKRRLMHFMTWDVDGPSSVYYPGGLGMDIAEYAPRTFDWIYDYLTEEERALCIEVLGKRIQQINDKHRGRPFESRPFCSHSGRMVGFAIEGSLGLLHEVDEAREWLEYTLRLLWSVFPAWGGEEGGWHEGVSYWGYYVGRVADFVAELDRLGIPIKEKPFFRNTGWFGLYTAYPGRQQRAFGDGYEKRMEGWFARHVGQILYAFSSLYEDPYLRWGSEQLAGIPTGLSARTIYKPELKAKPPEDLPHSRLFSDVGWVAMHSEMAEPENNIIFLMQSSTLGSISHNHANQNAFSLDAFGEALAISSGYYQTYGTGHHRDWVWNSRAHNTVLVNGEGQTPRSREARGEIVAYEEHGDWCYAAGDATPAYDGRLGKFVRHVIFVRPDRFVMIDELEGSGEGASFQWLLHARSPMRIDGEAGRVALAQGAAGMEVRFLQPDGLSFSQTTGWDPPLPRPEEAPPQYHLSVSTMDGLERTRVVSVLLPHRAGGEGDLPEVGLLPAQGGIAVQVGDSTVLWKEEDAEAVVSGEHLSNRTVQVFSNR